MAEPGPPRVRVLTDEEKAARDLARRKAAMETELHKLLDARSGDPSRASRYDLLADALLNTVIDRLFEAVNDPGFAESLAQRGYAVAVLPDGDPPPPPDEWADDAVGLYGWTGDMVDAVGHLDDLWKRAYLAGWAARDAQLDTGES